EAIVRWTTSPGVGGAMLRPALDEVRSIHRLTVSPSGPLKVEYLSFLKIFDDPAVLDSELPRDIPVSSHAAMWALFPMGEPDMSRRVAKMAWTNWLSQCDRPPHLRMPLAPGTAGHVGFT